MAQCLGNLWKKLFFNKGLISGLILLGQGEKQYFFRKKFSFLYTCFWTRQVAPPRFLATIVNLPINTWVQNNLEILATIANLATNQDTTLKIVKDKL